MFSKFITLKHKNGTESIIDINHVHSVHINKETLLVRLFFKNVPKTENLCTVFNTIKELNSFINKFKE